MNFADDMILTDVTRYKLVFEVEIKGDQLESIGFTTS